LELDEINNNILWELALKKEMDQLNEYSTFEDLGLGAKPPEGYSKIREPVIFSVKHDGCRNCRCAADGHLTAPVKERSCSGVASLRSMRIVVLVSELNNLKTMVGDIENAYLEAKTKKKVYIVAGHAQLSAYAFDVYC
jgi:hypothetical protein